jgi:hypothetical protein
MATAPGTIGITFKAILETVTTLARACLPYARAFEKTGNALENCAEWAEESTGAFKDQARLERQAAIREQTKELGLS